jgi:Ran GTPase-activating protein (RanGAP) involved in mRNA processing and transport
VLPRCSALAHLDLSDNRIGDDGAGSIAQMLPQFTLVRLDLSENDIADE